MSSLDFCCNFTSCCTCSLTLPVMKKYRELQDDRIFFTTFHQSLDYEDFIEGLKPRIQASANGESIGVTYEPEDGIFKRACNAVETDGSKDIIECIDDYLQKIKGFGNKRIIPTLSGRSILFQTVCLR